MHEVLSSWQSGPGTVRTPETLLALTRPVLSILHWAWAWPHWVLKNLTNGPKYSTLPNPQSLQVLLYALWTFYFRWSRLERQDFKISDNPPSGQPKSPQNCNEPLPCFPRSIFPSKQFIHLLRLWTGRLDPVLWEVLCRQRLLKPPTWHPLPNSTLLSHSHQWHDLHNRRVAAKWRASKHDNIIRNKISRV